MRYASLRDGLQFAICPSISGGGGIVPDLSGRNNHATLTNMDAADYVAYQRGIALDFDAANDFLDYGRCDQLSGLGFLSCSFWCFPKSTTGMYALIRYNTTAALGSERRADYFGVEASGGILYPVCYFSIAGTPTSYQSFTSTALSIPVNAWSHVAISVGLATNTATIAVNGASVTATRSTAGTSPTATAAQGTVGWRSQTYTGSTAIQFYFDGCLDDIRAYQKLLTPQDAQLLATEPGIGLRPERTSVFFGAQLFQAAWLAQGRNIIGGGVC